jgi:hypothetical protein
MPKQYRLYIITVYEIMEDGRREILKSPVPAPTSAKAKSEFLKEYSYFKEDKYEIVAKIAAVKGLPHWKIVLEQTGLAKKGENRAG